MIKPNELRIGNIVTINIPGREPHYNQWEVIDFGLPPQIVQPIPLTPAWLERMGFAGEYYPKRSNLGNWQIRRGPWWFMTIAHYRGDKPYWGEGGGKRWKIETGANGYLTHIEYVHQLQNLFFALTGEELTVKEVMNGNV